VTATAAPRSADPSTIGDEGRTWPIVVQLARRSAILVTRLPSAFIPSIVFPIFLIVAFSGSYNGLSEARAFDNAMSWFAPLAVIQGAAFVGVGAGFSATREIETGFFDRLLLAPAPRRALLLGPGLASMMRTLVPFATVVAVALLGGAELPGGAVGLLTLLAAAMGTSLVHTFWTLGLAYRFKSQRAAPIMQIGVFITNFLATAQVPLSLMTGWLHAVARVNPMTNVFRLGRAGWIGEPTWSLMWGGIVALAVFTSLAYVFAARGLKRMIP
jgi:ABC-2 type transport system permease protein